MTRSKLSIHTGWISRIGGANRILHMKFERAPTATIPILGCTRSCARRCGTWPEVRQECERKLSKA